MNFYEINVKDANGVNHKRKIYEINVGEAQKEAFALGATLGAVKLADCTVALLQEHTGVYKETETEQLAKIKNILRGLGPDGYCAAAFDGCVEIAEDNIRDDFVNSMKRDLESANEKASQLDAQLEKVKEDLKKATEKANFAMMEAAEAKKQLAKAKNYRIPADVLGRLMDILREKAENAEGMAIHNADLMAECFGNPERVENATRYAQAYKAARKEQVEAENMLETLETQKEAPNDH